ncbi:hypothetical protein [Streptomyces sp. AGS-58]|uniref:hypothetical protein n=1 Tax=unclassified Streptomyces TaxID=2593676 RepID=UPI0035A2BD10
MSRNTEAGDGRRELTTPARTIVLALAVLALVPGAEVTRAVRTALLATGLVGGLCGACLQRRRGQ